MAKKKEGEFEKCLSIFIDCRIGTGILHCVGPDPGKTFGVEVQ
jgi:hypothetical protein